MSEITLTDGLMLSPYGKAVVVYGPKTEAYKDDLKGLGGRWNGRLTSAPRDWTGCCWVFPGFKRDSLVRHFGRRQQPDAVVLDEQQVIDDSQPVESSEISLTSDLYAVEYDDKLLIYGNTYPYRGVFKALKGRWDNTVKLRHPKGGCCWVVGGQVDIDDLKRRLSEKTTKKRQQSPIQTRASAQAPSRVQAPVPVETGKVDRHRDVVVELATLGTESLELLLKVGDKSPERTALLAATRAIMPRERFPDPLERRNLVERALEASKIDF